jgi:hypothetical protein
VADNSHAERQILARVVASYMRRRAAFPAEPEWTARENAVAQLASTARLDETDAAVLLADALARRAANKLIGGS